jgi:small-conductance mechanosensitive channel
MKSFMALAATLCLVLVWVLALPEALALALSPQAQKTGSSLTIPIMFAAVVLCLVIGVVLRAFSEPTAELSLNQRTK